MHELDQGEESEVGVRSEQRFGEGKIVGTFRERVAGLAVKRALEIWKFAKLLKEN